MGEYKRIERLIGSYLAPRYRSAVEIGVGSNPDAAIFLRGNGVRVRCTDIRPVPPVGDLDCISDDIFSPDLGIYAGADLLYSIRPAVEMVPPMIAVARAVNADLIVYHLGFESYGNGGEPIRCGVTLHRYNRRSEPAEG